MLGVAVPVGRVIGAAVDSDQQNVEGDQARNHVPVTDRLRDLIDLVVVDALCEPPQSFTYGGVIATCSATVPSAARRSPAC